MGCFCSRLRAFNHKERLYVHQTAFWKWLGRILEVSVDYRQLQSYRQKHCRTNGLQTITSLNVRRTDNCIAERITYRQSHRWTNDVQTILSLNQWRTYNRISEPMTCRQSHRWNKDVHTIASLNQWHTDNRIAEPVTYRQWCRWTNDVQTILTILVDGNLNGQNFIVKHLKLCACYLFANYSNIRSQSLSHNISSKHIINILKRISFLIVLKYLLWVCKLMDFFCRVINFFLKPLMWSINTTIIFFAGSGLLVVFVICFYNGIRISWVICNGRYLKP